MTRELEPVAVVTGGSSGAGRALARGLARRGFAVVVVYLGGQAAVDAMVEEIVGAGGTALAVRADVADALDVERLLRETETAFGGLDVLIHPTVGLGERPARELTDLLAAIEHREQPE